MSLISEILQKEHIFLDMDVTSKKRVFEQVGLVFENSYGIARSIIFESLFEREKLGSTALGQEVAIPHGRIKNLKKAVGAFVRVKQPIPFDAPDGKPVSLIFILLVPANATDVHLQTLSELAQFFSAKTLREALFAATSAEEILHVVSEWKPYATNHS